MFFAKMGLLKVTRSSDEEEVWKRYNEEERRGTTKKKKEKKKKWFVGVEKKLREQVRVWVVAGFKIGSTRRGTGIFVHLVLVL